MSRIVAVGDVMLGDHPVCMGHGVGSQIARHGFEHVFGQLPPELFDADVVFGNLESVLTNKSKSSHRLRGTEMRGAPESADGLRRLGFNVLSVANNHALQHGLAAFEDSCETLKTAGIAPVGLSVDGLSNVVTIETPDGTVSVIAYSMRPEKYEPDSEGYARAGLDKICHHVSRVREQCDSLVLSLHWGNEYLNYPNLDQLDASKRLVDAGVDLLLGHHPHVLQGREQINQSIVLYSLGNFVFDKGHRNAKESVVFRCRLANGTLSDDELIPIEINRHFQPTIPSTTRTRAIKRKLAQLDDAIKSRDPQHIVEAETAAVREDKAYFRSRMHSYLYFLRNIYRYDLDILSSSAIRFVRRRLRME